MELPRDQMAFRKRYQDLLLTRRLFTVFRPGNRLYPNRRGYIPGEVVTARVIEIPGSDEAQIAPVFNDLEVKIEIDAIEVKNVHDLEGSDFEGSSPDVHDLNSLKQHLQEIYERPIAEYDNLVTRIHFRYLDEKS